MDLYSLYATLSLDTSSYEQQVENARKSGEKLGSSLGSTAKQASKAGDSIDDFAASLTKSVTAGSLMASLLSKLASTAVDVGKQLVTTGVNYNAELEKYQTALTTLLGSAQAAESALEAIKEDAARTPFDTAGLVQANQYLIATGESAEDSRKVINALGDAVSAVGGGNDELQRMAQNLQQIKNAGEATAADVKQFAYAGIDIYSLLADYLGKDVSLVKTADASYENLTNALTKAAEEGGKFYGAMDAQSETFNGTFSTLKDNFEQFTGKATKGLTDGLIPVMQTLNDKIVYLTDTIDWDSFNNDVVEIFGNIATAIDAVSSSAEWLATKIGNVSSAIQTMKGIMSGEAQYNFLKTAWGTVTDTASNWWSSVTTGTNKNDIRNNSAWIAAQKATNQYDAAKLYEAGTYSYAGSQQQAQDDFEEGLAEFRRNQTKSNASSSGTNKKTSSTTASVSASTSTSKSTSSSSTKKTTEKELTDAQKLSNALAALGEGYTYSADASSLAADKLAYYEGRVASAQEKVDKLTYLFQQATAGTNDTGLSTEQLAQELISAETEFKNIKDECDDYKDSIDEAKKSSEKLKTATTQLKTAISESASVVSSFGDIISDVGDALTDLGNESAGEFVSDMGSFIKGIANGITSVLNFISQITTLITTLTTLQTTLKTTSAISSALSFGSSLASVAGTAATTAVAGTAAATTTAAAVGGTSALAGIGGIAAGVLSGPVGWGLLAGGLLLGGGALYASYKQKQRQQEEAEAAAKKAQEEAAAAMQKALEEAEAAAKKAQEEAEKEAQKLYSVTRPGVNISDVNVGETSLFDTLTTSIGDLTTNVSGLFDSLKLGTEGEGLIGSAVKTLSDKIGGTVIEININGAQYTDEESLAKAVSRELQNLSNRGASVFA